MATRHGRSSLQPADRLLHRARPQRGGPPLPPVVHAVDARRPGADRGLLRVRRLDLGRLLRHARRPHRRVRRRRSGSPRRRRAPTARCSPSTARRARTSSSCACSRSSGPTRSCSSPATAITPWSTRSRGTGWTSASSPRPTTPEFEAVLPPSAEEVDGRAAALSRGAGRRLHVADLRGAVRGHAGDRRLRARRLAGRDPVRRRGVGRAPALPSRRCRRPPWTPAPTSPCSRRTSSRAGCSRPG